MTRTELLDAAFTKLVEAVKLLGSAAEELLVDDALELAERVNLRISAGPERTPCQSNQYDDAFSSDGEWNDEAQRVIFRGCRRRPTAG
jgi:hypothetical protein